MGRQCRSLAAAAALLLVLVLCVRRNTCETETERDPDRPRVQRQQQRDARLPDSDTTRTTTADGARDDQQSQPLVEQLLDDEKIDRVGAMPMPMPMRKRVVKQLPEYSTASLDATGGLLKALLEPLPPAVEWPPLAVAEASNAEQLEQQLRLLCQHRELNASLPAACALLGYRSVLSVLIM